ncbi:AraC family transcriptional regulator ligand-binding domain-containing protein [Sulfitobacter mediterraneus]|uniref:helix-turn-helix domain-containing protein n=1 Tax=Sulfitobacter mediterraneus TaxID=83219 RepID=UPI00193A9B0C|nr:AraC family transcriptional regulator [Sulfitobacter mediterraneus]MBM1558604.1 AraC family transcriptional regulator ligand-binding domain-containing protein [Sulfitobacter mediterraneus]MBM1570014.1 AraC family transcriptional regulator ligand-binding domain-containing protein [Sulfitobacter mediterraneus]MBM1573924.1 AraC family transcriptional regulator ligand-binding domain-containing protein [Sulfitobacter mediterraneus]MBM1577755.1 AraC family transcriptional regulator ligand-binding 
MNSAKTLTILPTVSRAFLDDWLAVLRRDCSARQMADFLDKTGLSAVNGARGRVTHDQIVRLYQMVVAETGDEMMGLCSRTIRPGALKHLCASVRGASSLSAALFRFTSFWNLLLDDYEMTLANDGETLRMALVPRGDQAPQRFGHMLLLKLTHGVASWLAGYELPLTSVGFCFERPEFAADYPILFPAAIRFGQAQSYVSFDASVGPMPVSRTEAEMQEFLIRAPRDWIFTSLNEHALPLRVRELLLASDRLEAGLRDAAQQLHLTPRTLMRRLDAEGTSFQGIKDGLRRDLAIRDLAQGGKSIEAISLDVGFASAANFHRAFKRWTDLTPGAYRKKSRISVPAQGANI